MGVVLPQKENRLFTFPLTVYREGKNITYVTVMMDLLLKMYIATRA